MGRNVRLFWRVVLYKMFDFGVRERVRSERGEVFGQRWKSVRSWSVRFKKRKCSVQNFIDHKWKCPVFSTIGPDTLPPLNRILYVKKDRTLLYFKTGHFSTLRPDTFPRKTGHFTSKDQTLLMDRTLFGPGTFRSLDRTLSPTLLNFGSHNFPLLCGSVLWFSVE